MAAGGSPTAPAPEGADAARAAQLLDYDNDGLLDLLTWSASGPRVSRNLGRRWMDVSRTAVPRSAASAAQSPSPRGLALADVDGDGSTDLVTGDSGVVTLWRNSGTSAHRPPVVAGRAQRAGSATGVASARRFSCEPAASRDGSKRLQRHRRSAPADLVFGLGTRTDADVVRALWPSGILQAETVQHQPGASPNTPLVIEELDRKPSSCPFLFTWNGERFEFVTDFIGAGEMGYWDGPGVEHKPDPLELVRIRGDQLQPRDGKLEIRVTNELEEALFVDRLQLLAIAHPRDVEVYPNEGMTDPPKPFRLFAVADSRDAARVRRSRPRRDRSHLAHRSPLPRRFRARALPGLRRRALR